MGVSNFDTPIFLLTSSTSVPIRNSCVSPKFIFLQLLESFFHIAEIAYRIAVI